MSGEYLFSVCGAHGIDFKQVAGSSSNTKGIARRRKLTADERKRGVPSVSLTARGAQTRVYRAPQRSIVDLALAGVGHIPTLVGYYSFCRDRSVYWELWSFVAQEAKRIMRANRWPPMLTTITTQQPSFYHDRLAQLILDSEFDEYRPLFVRNPLLYAWYMDVAPRTWDREIEPRFVQLRASYDRWLGLAGGAVDRKISRYMHDMEVEYGRPWRATNLRRP